jgi:small subunit ribosomal protein S17
VTKFKAHDEDNKCRIGDAVKILEVRPLSKEKRWMVLEVLDKTARGG